MTKRFFAWLLVLALVLSMIPAITLGITAEESLDKHTSHEGWTEWTDKTKLPSEAGKYYLSADVTLTSVWYVSTEIHLCLNSHNITQTTAGSRVLGVLAGGNVSIYDCTGTTNEDGIYTAGKLTGGSQIIGAGVNVNRGGVFNLYGGKIVGNSKSGTDGGGVYLQAAKADSKTAGMFNMYGGQICGNSSKRGAGVYVAGGLSGDGYTNAVFNMYGGIIGGYGENDANVAEAEGGAIFAATYGAVNIQGGKIVGNKAKTGSAIYASDSIVVTAKNAEITDNTATSQSAIWTKGNVKVTLENTEISGNTAPVASALYAQNNVQLTVKDSAITGNIGSNTSADGYGAALYICGNGSRVVVSGKTIIADNVIANEAIADLFINSSVAGAANEMLYVKDLDGYVKFGVKDKAASVTEASQVVAFDGAASTYAGASVSYMAGTEEKHVGLVDGAFTFVTGHFHQGVEYTKWTNSTKVPSSGTYYLDTDVVAGTKGTVDNGAVLQLCMNGHSISGNSKTGELLRVANGSAYICDCTTLYDENGYFVSGGKFENGLRKGNGAAIFINKASSVLEVEGVAFVGNKSTEVTEGYGGGAIHARLNTTPARFVGCRFEDNESACGGGAIALRQNSKVQIEKTVFVGNTSDTAGGAIYATTGTATIIDCLFRENAATGADRVASEKTEHMTGTGGAIFASAANFTIKNSTFVSNSAEVSAALNMNKTTTATVEGCTFTGNTASGVSAIGIFGATNLTLRDSAVTGNSNAGGGYGAVNLASGDAVVKLQGKVVIAGNTDKDGAAQNLHLQAGKTIDVDLSGLGAGSQVGVSLYKDRIEAGDLFFSTGGITAVPDGVTSDNADYQVVVDDQGRLALSNTAPPEAVHSHKLCNDEACTAHGDAVSFKKWDKTDSLPKSGFYYLENDVELTTVSYVTGELKLCLNGHTVKQTAKDRVLYIQDGSSLAITDCGTTGTITGGRGDTGASIYLTDGTTFDLYGGKITGSAPASTGKATSGAAIFLRSATKAGATFNMYGGEITGNGDEKSWGGAITNAAGNANNCVYVNIYGGKIHGNTAATGGAIRMENKSLITMSGGEIYGNEATDRGGAIYLGLGGPELIIKGGKIYGNTATNGGGIYAYSGVKITLEGNITIYDNTASDKQNNLYLAGSDKITVRQLKDTAKIGIHAATYNRAISATNDTDYSANFQPDNSKLTVSYREKALWLEKIETSDHYHKVCVDVVHGNCAHDKNQMWIMWGDDENEIGKLPASGCYYLTKDVELTEVSYVTGELQLCLNGHTVKQTAKDRVLYIQDGGSLAITDCGTTGTVTGGRGDTGASIYLTDGTTFDLYSGKITGSAPASTGKATSGAAIFLRSATKAGATFNMYGGEITGNGDEKSWGGAITNAAGNANNCVYVNIYGGKIHGNTAATGGAIRMENKSLITMSGGEIYDNTADMGGAIYLGIGGPELIIKDGKIHDNYAKATVTVDPETQKETKSGGQGGGIAVYANGVVRAYGGKIIGNRADTQGGGIYMRNGSELHMDGGKLEGNSAGVTGGGIFASGKNSTITMNGGEIAGNKADTQGGGIYMINGANLHMAGGKLEGNSAGVTGGGIFASGKGSTITMDGGEISGNTAKSGGGVITQTQSVFTMNDGTITGNVTTHDGGGVYISTNTVFIMNGGSVSGNTAKYAGGIYVYRSEANLLGGTVSNNRAQHTSTWKNGKEVSSGGTGGGMYISGANVNLKGTSFVGNYASVHGGAIVTGRASYTEGGVKKVKNVTVNYSAGLISGNKAERAGGAMLIQSEGTVVNMYGGTVTGNKAKAAGGIYASTKTKFNMYGGTITQNYATAQGGALYILNSTANITGGQICNNTAGANSGLIIVDGNTAVLNIKNMKLHDGEAKIGGVMVVQSKAHVFAENCDFYDNTANSGAGGAVYISTNSYSDFTDCKFWGNKSSAASGAIHVTTNSKVNITRCDFTENSAETMGGAMYCYPKTVINITDSSFRKNTAVDNGGALVCRSTMYLTNVTIEDCSAKNGGAIATDTNNAVGVGDMDGLILKNCELRNNTAAEQGGALYIWKGRPLELHDSKLTGNTAGTEGSAIWAYEDTWLHNATITGNTSGSQGYAVYMNDANYDGHSYYTSKNKLSGNTVIRDNQGGDLFMGPDVVFVVAAEGLGENVHMEVVLDSGVITNRVLGVYHYEGGDRVYTITYGDRSVIDPEIDPTLVQPADDETAKTEKVASGDTLLYVGIGVFAAAIIAVGVILVVKKKKAGNTAEKATKE